MVDDSGEAPSLRMRSTLIINLAMPNYDTDLFDLALDSSWHRGQVTQHDIHKLRLLTLSLTCNLRTFIRLLQVAKPHIDRYESKWLPRRIDVAATKCQADIVEFLIKNEGAEVNENGSNDVSLFYSCCLTEFVKGWRLQDRDSTLLSHAARAGHSNVVKILLDAGARHDHAIEFTAMCGSRTLVRLLWERGDNKNDAVQGALAMAIDREDTAMFHLSEEIGAKFDDDVRVAVIKKAQEEGLESMVRLLSKDKNPTYEGLLGR